MQTYDLLKILELTKICMDKTKIVLTAATDLTNGDLAYLCSYYVSLHDLRLIIEDFFIINSVSDNKKIEDDAFLTKVMKYVKLTAHFEAESTKFISFYIH